ncbi:mechanosensitive ion channel family protein [Luteolibacter yonseiensis]|uniref:Mechanosensitive ion channel family protein n=1 Tax=Luteolibacter yonseiensis TaxID=1144680 RepID=A0A934VDC3_9BACT|nr:mechanosensitive ion channel family protein [Luteolibacter yonseiensis]MBK1818000.1 mechanosensitive ion channel family protein [Luteolibacter yonseiensis]
MTESNPLTAFLEQFLPEWFFASKYGTPLWVWMSLPLLILTISVIVKLVGAVSLLLLRRTGRMQKQWLVESICEGRSPLQVALGVVIFRGAKTLLPMSAHLQVFLGYAEAAIIIFSAIWFLLNLTVAIAERLRVFLDRSGRSHAKAVIPLARKVANTAIVIIGIMFFLQNMNVNVGAMLAGLGIGGLALALAGQKTVENLFGGIALVMDQPARVGDPCNYEGGTGVVEDVGLRSTRIRTPDRSVVTIPNSKLAEMKIESFAFRDQILLKSLVRLRYETTPEQMKSVLEGIRGLLSAHPDIAENARATFNSFSDTSLDIEIFGYVKSSDYNVFLAVREKVFLDIMDVVVTSGTAFSSPARQPV